MPKIRKEQLCDNCRQITANTSDGNPFTVEQLLDSSTYNSGNSLKVHGGNITVKKILEANGNCRICVPLFAAAITK